MRNLGNRKQETGNRKARASRGYTLLEMIVSVGIFSIVMLAATGAYLSLIRLDREARAVNHVANNLSFAVDSMARAIRTGTSYRCNNNAGSPNCTATPGTSFGFQDAETPARTIVYSLSSGRVVVSINGGTPIPITDPSITVQNLTFYVRGVGTGDGVQPQAAFTIRGVMPTSPGASAAFSIQGSATSRTIDL